MARVQLLVSDPWDLTDGGAVSGTIQSSTNRFPALVVLDQPLRGSASRATRHFVFDTRIPDQWEALESGQQLECTMTGISETQAMADDSIDASAWRVSSREGRRLVGVTQAQCGSSVRLRTCAVRHADGAGDRHRQ